MPDDQIAFGLVLQYAEPTRQQQLATIARTETGDGQADVRRPLDALRARPDQYATLSMCVRGTNDRELVSNTSVRGGRSTFTANMMIQNVSQSVTEKVQISQTFDDDRLFFFGKNLDTLNIAALLVENDSFQWVHEWHANYLSGVRGTIAAERGTEAELTVEDVRYYGYITQFALTRASTDRHLTTLQFTMVTTRQQFLRELRSTFELSSADATGLSAALDEAALLARGTVVSTQAPPSLLQIARQATADATSVQSAPPRLGTTREAFPSEYPNNAQGLPIDQVRDVQINSALSNKLLKAPSAGADRVRRNLYDYDTQKQDSLLRAKITTPAQRVDAQARAAAPRTEPLFDRYVGLLPPGMPIGVFQVRQVGLGLLSIAIDAVASTAATSITQALTGGSGNIVDTFSEALRARAGLVRPPEFDDSQVLG